jgi:citrate lyase subunit beta/citryl-CoA lyase
MMAKAAGSDADEVIFDLEDACAVSQKVAARRTLVDALRSLDFGGKVRAFRVNGLKTPWFFRDVVEVIESAGALVDSVVLPKVESADDVKFVDRLLAQIEATSGLEVGRIRLEVLIESARALLRAEEISVASPRLSALIFGVADYAGDVGARDISRGQSELFHYPKSHLLTVARAAGLDAIDSVTVQFRDLEQVKRDAQAGARMGFDGKWAIHPSHLEPIHEAYTPTRDELTRAVAILRAYAEADAREGKGALVFGDEMIDAAGLRLEWRRVAIGLRAGLLGEDGKLRATNDLLE